MAALTAGECSERHAAAMAQATSGLSDEHRAEVDRRVGPLLGGLGLTEADRAARRVAAEVDAASVVRRMEAAVRSRRVSVRRAADGMAYLTVLGPMVEVAGAQAALQTRARAVVSGHCPDERHEGRGLGAVAADTALAALSGREPAMLQPVEVHLVMTDRALAGTGDPDRPVMEPARIPGHGSIPAPVARWWLRGADEGSVWLRRLYTSPSGRDLVAMDSRRRLFTGLLRRMLVLRDDVCTTPWCGAAIAHADHATPARDGGPTDFVEGNGKCVRCNHTKEAPGGAPGRRDGRRHRPRGAGGDHAHRPELPFSTAALDRLGMERSVTRRGRTRRRPAGPGRRWSARGSSRRRRGRSRIDDPEVRQVVAAAPRVQDARPLGRGRQPRCRTWWLFMLMSNHWVRDHVVAGVSEQPLRAPMQASVLPRCRAPPASSGCRRPASTVTRFAGSGRSSAMTSHSTLRRATDRGPRAGTAGRPAFIITPWTLPIAAALPRG